MMKKILLVGLLGILAAGLLVSAVTGAAVLVQRFFPKAEVAQAQEEPAASVEPVWEEEPGVLLVAIGKGSPAAEAGLRRGDIILAVDGEELESSADLREAISAREPGTTVTLTILRCEEPEEMSVTLGEVDGRDAGYLGVTPWPPMRVDYFVHEPGIGAFEIEKELVFHDGALVIEVVEDSPAAAAALQEGDRVVTVDGEEVTAEHSLTAIIRSKSAGDRVVLELERDGEPITTEATLAEHPEEAGVAYLGVRLAGFPAFHLDACDGEMPIMPIPEHRDFDFGEGALHGALVVEVAQGSPAEEANLQKDDLILAVDGEPLDGPNALVELIAAHEPGDEVELTVRRGEEELTLNAVLGASPQDEAAAYLGVRANAFLRRQKRLDGDWDGEMPDLEHLWEHEEFPFGLHRLDRFRSEDGEFDFDFDFHHEFEWPEGMEDHLHEMPVPGWLFDLPEGMQPDIKDGSQV